MPIIDYFNLRNYFINGSIKNKLDLYSPVLKQ